MVNRNGFFYILCNKPGRLSFGTQQDFDDEENEGYSPTSVSEATARSMAIHGDDLGDSDNGGRWSVHLSGDDSVSVPAWFAWCLKRQEIRAAIRPQLEEIEGIDRTLKRIDMALGGCENPPKETNVAKW